MEIKILQEEHYPRFAEIYLQGIRTGYATFETQAPLWEDWDKSHLPYGRIGLFEKNILMGWAALTAVSSRCVYAGVAEVSLYVASEYQGRGMGKLLLDQLIYESEKNGIWTLQSGIFTENSASIRVHEKAGFRKIGFREKIGQLQGKWKDTLLMERRSRVVGMGG